MKTASALQFHILFFLLRGFLPLLIAAFRSVDAAADLLQFPDLAPCRFQFLVFCCGLRFQLVVCLLYTSDAADE